MSQIQIPIPNKYLGFGCNVWENLDKGLTVPKWVLINWPKIPQWPQNLFAHIVCLSPKVWDFNEKRLYWASVVRATNVDILRHKSRRTPFRIQSAIQNKTYNIINFSFSQEEVQMLKNDD